MNQIIQTFLILILVLNEALCLRPFAPSEHTPLLSILNEACYSIRDSNLGLSNVERVQKRLEMYKKSFPMTADILQDISLYGAEEEYTIFQNTKKRIIYFVVRGTDVTKISDLFNDFQLLLLPFNFRMAKIDGIIYTKINQWKGLGNKVIFSGHSLGGSIALHLYSVYESKVDHCEVHNPLITPTVYGWLKINDLVESQRLKILIHYTIGDRLRLLYKTLEFFLPDLEAQISDFKIPSKIKVAGNILGKHEALGLFAKCFLENADSSYSNLDLFIKYSDDFSCDEPSPKKRIIENEGVCPCVTYSVEKKLQIGIGFGEDTLKKSDILVSNERYSVISKGSETLTFKETRKIFDE